MNSMDNFQKNKLNEDFVTISLGIAIGSLLLRGISFLLKKFGQSVKLNTKIGSQKLKEIINKLISDSILKTSSPKIKDNLLNFQLYIKSEIDNGNITTMKELIDEIEKAKRGKLKVPKNVYLEESYKKIIRNMISEILINNKGK